MTFKFAGQICKKAKATTARSNFAAVIRLCQGLSGVSEVPRTEADLMSSVVVNSALKSPGEKQNPAETSGPHHLPSYEIAIKVEIKLAM